MQNKVPAYNYTIAETDNNLQYFFASNLKEAGDYLIQATVLTIGELRATIYQNLDFTNQQKVFYPQSTVLLFDEKLDDYFKTRPKSFSILIAGTIRAYWDTPMTFYLSSNMEVSLYLDRELVMYKD